MRGYNLPDNVNPNDPAAPWNQEDLQPWPGYEYEEPHIRQAIAQESLENLNDVYDNLCFLERSDPDYPECFGDSFSAIDRIKQLIIEYMGRIYD
jgi:hypothetical protein